MRSIYSHFSVSKFFCLDLLLLAAASVSAQTLSIETLAGDGTPGATNGFNARFNHPTGVAADNSATVYVADTENSTIRKITSDGFTTTLAGLAGTFGSADGTNATFYGPQGIAADASGQLYVADTANGTIRKLTPAGVATTLAGIAGTFNSFDGSGTNAQFFHPEQIAADAAGNLYVSDTWNHTIRKITPAGAVSTLAGLAGKFGAADGTNSKARFNRPTGLALDTATNLYIADSLNHTIRKITPAGKVTTIAGLAGVWGSADGSNNAARFYLPAGITVATNGDILVADSGNQTLRRISASGTNWVVTTIAGANGIAGNANGVGTNAQFYFPDSLALDSAGFVYVADTANNSIRTTRILPASFLLSIQPDSASLSPGGTAALTLYVSPVNGFTNNVALSVASLPPGISAGFVPPSLTASGYSTLTLTASLSAIPGTYPLQIVANSTLMTNNATITLVIKPPVVGWGYDNFGQSDPPSTLTNATSISAGAYHSLALRADGTVAAWGNNDSGQCNVPPTLTNAIAIAAGSYHNLALRADGSVVAWGDDSYGQSTVPPSATNVAVISAGGWHSLALRVDGSVLAWGNDGSGQTDVPSSATNVIAIAAGGQHSLALRADGTAVAWGSSLDAYGQYAGQSDVPAGLGQILAIAAGGYHSLALSLTNGIVAWGDNSSNQTQIPTGLTNVAAIAAGSFHSLALLANGSVVGWGNNYYGQISFDPALTGVTAIAAGGYHSLTLAGSAPPALVLPVPVRSGKTLTFQFPTVRGKDYFLLSNGNLANSAWSWGGASLGDGDQKTLTDSITNSPQRFYRLRRQ
jgi:alpha-tubulin suppressor-like RCC1 family protein/sugar lactone lactonase YvrE